MATSGSTNFTLNLEEIIEEAYDRCGLRSSTGYDYTSARRSMDLLFVEWQNRGTNFWTIDELSLSTVSGTTTYTLPTSVFDLIECYIRQGSGQAQVDTPVTRISISEYASISNKKVQGRPTNIWVDKQRVAIQIRLWPTPNAVYTFAYHALTRIEDSGSPATNDADLPYRFLPALVAGLASKLAVKKVGDPNKVALLKMEYEEAWNDAVAGDRDRASWRVRPGGVGRI